MPQHNAPTYCNGWISCRVEPNDRTHTPPGWRVSADVIAWVLVLPNARGLQLIDENGTRWRIETPDLVQFAQREEGGAFWRIVYPRWKTLRTGRRRAQLRAERAKAEGVAV
jgi:hypothetical protein